MSILADTRFRIRIRSTSTRRASTSRNQNYSSKILDDMRNSGYFYHP